MSKFMETYGTALFVLVLMAILISFAGPLGLKLKEYTLDRTNNIHEIGRDVMNDGNSSMDTIYACLYTDGELILSSNEITPNKEVLNNYGTIDLTKTDYDQTFPWVELGFKGNNTIKTVNIIDEIKPKTCIRMFYNCNNLIQIKNLQNLDTSACVNMSGMFGCTNSLILTDLSCFDTSNVVSMQNMFCGSFSKPNNWVTNDLLNTLKNWNVSNVKTMENMFFNDKGLTDASILLQWKNNGSGLNEQLNTKSMFNMTNCKNPFE